MQRRVRVHASLAAARRRAFERSCRAPSRAPHIPRARSHRAAPEMREHVFPVTDAHGRSRKFLVEFPYDAYDAQIVFMERALEAMSRRQSALLESPTGTGKTLCLLASALSYVRNEGRSRKRKDREERRERESEAGTSGEGRAGGAAARGAYDDDIERRARTRAPVIVYATRTHSQVDQVVRELKKLDPMTRMTTLASRRHACVRDDVRALTGQAQSNRCAKLVTDRECGAKMALDFALEGKGGRLDVWGEGVQDIEELVTKAKRERGPCPFYLSRTKCAEAEIIFMPYNYLLDESVRRGLDIQWSDAVVIVDEAHNLEASAADSMSFSLTAAKLAKAIEETTKAHETKLTIDDDTDEGIVQAQDREMFSRGLGEEAAAFKAEDVYALGRTFMMLEDVLDRISREAGRNGEHRGGLGESLGDGGYVYDILAEVGITEFTYTRVVGLMRCAARMVQLGDSFMTTTSQRDTPLMEIANFIELLFKKRHEEYFVTRIGPDEEAFKTSKKARQGPTLSYWCFFPGLCLKELIEKEVGSFLLASGTLSPMESFSAELGMEFPVRLENPHVIQRSQIWGGVVTSGPSGSVLNSSFRFRDTQEYKTEIGNVILSSAKIVPDGLLVFFPSYGVMNACIKHWKSIGLWGNLEMTKTCVVEPNNSEEFQEAYGKYNEALKDRRGAAFFAVCRGKVSEGIDFADKACRGVILTGIPYAGAKDPLVMQKRRFLDKRRDQNGGGYSGNEWYSQTAMRAVNQALGRAIRHKHDFGAVILADERFANENARNQLSLWLRPSVQVHTVFNSVVSGLREFFHSQSGATNFKPVPAPARFVDIAVVKSKPTLKASSDARNKSMASVTSLMRQFSKNQGADEDDEARKQFMLVSKQTVPLRATKVDLFGEARDRQTKEAMKKSPLLMQLSQSRAAPESGQGVDLVSDENAGATKEERSKLFMRRARLELARDSYDELVREIEKVNTAEFDIRDLLRVASRVLKAPENPNGLYSLFGEFVPAPHKPVYEKHRRALVERQEQAKARKTVSGDISQLAVVAPPTACVVCAQPCNKPFEASGCRHAACYACWLGVVKPKGPGSCPSCSAEVLKKHLLKKFF